MLFWIYTSLLEVYDNFIITLLIQIELVLWELNQYLLSFNGNMKEISPHIDKLFWEIAVNDNEYAFSTLFFQFFSPLCIFAHRYIERWETCEDVVQESFLKIWENRKSIRIETFARNFLVTSVRNNCIDYLRKQELESTWKQWKINREHEPEGDIYSIVELRAMLTEALD